MSLKEKLSQIQQIEEWNSEKGPLVEANKRLQVSGALQFLAEALSITSGARFSITPQIQDRIEFDPKQFTHVKASLEWGRRELQGFDRTVSIGP